MRMIPFWKVTPGGNPTLFLRSEDVPPARRAPLAAALMDPMSIGAEQTGFIRFGHGGVPRLDMMGGEFCLNASRAFAFLLAVSGFLQESVSGEFSGCIEVSGADGPVPVKVWAAVPETGSQEYMAHDEASSGIRPGSHAEAHGTWGSAVAEASLRFGSIPVPEDAEGARVVRLPGIVHVIHDGMAPADAEMESFCTGERLRLGLGGEEAVGHLWVTPGACDAAADPGTGEGKVPLLSLYPVVWVRDTATLCRETSCGSGTLACAADARHRSGGDVFSVVQPSGSALTVAFRRAGEMMEVGISGPVRMAARGEADAEGLM